MADEAADMVELVGKKCGPIPYEYTFKDVVLYALSVGARADDLPFIYENARGGLKVLPGFVSVMSGGLLWELVRDLEVDLSRFFHGEEEIKVYRPIPNTGTVYVRGEIPAVYDKLKGALIVCRMSIAGQSGELLADVEHGIFYAGAGGFGGDPGPKTKPFEPPETVEPDFSVSCPIPENQAALYRLNGDLNPLHIDPEFAARGGFGRPILHGLCTYGYAARTVLHAICGSDVSRFRRFKVRFSGVVYPGDTLVTEGWKEREGRYLVRSRTDRGVVLSHGCAEVGGEEH